MELRSGKKLCQEGERSNSLDSNPSNQLLAVDRNPMMNSVVLRRLFEFCDLSDLLEYRLVSKAWYFSSLARIRNEMFVNISADPDSSLNYANVIQEFNVEGPPFRCFRLSDVEFMTAPPLKRQCSEKAKHLALMTKTNIRRIYENVEQLWGKYGQFMRKLHLAPCPVYSVEAFQKVILQNTPNLEVLDLDGLEFGVGANKPNEGASDEIGKRMVQMNLKILMVSMFSPLPIPWEHLFLQFPKIKKLILNGVQEDAITPLLQGLESVDEIPLKELDLWEINQDCVSWPSSLINLFRLRKLTLTTLGIHLEDCAEEEMDMLQVALRMHGDTLEDLNLCVSFSSLKLEPTNNFPYRPEPLEQLTRLVLLGPIFKDAQFLRQTPNLKVLHLDLNRSEANLKLGFKNVKNVVLPQLTEFRLSGKGISRTGMKMLVKIMPNMEFFEGCINPLALRVIFKKWKNLRVLMVNSNIGDEELTGIGKGIGKRLPNITDLNNLRALTIDKDSCGNIGDSSIWNGFMKLPYLSYLSLALSPQTSREAFEALRNRAPEGTIEYGGRESVGRPSRYDEVEVVEETDEEPEDNDY